jgi:ribosomal protein L11 methylase PrmA
MKLLQVRDVRWQNRVPEGSIDRESHFFDEEAALLSDPDLVMPAQRIARYRQARAGALNIPLDALFAHLMPLEGKEVLDYGCGSGESAVMMAACGATKVTAFDISPLSVAKGQRRAELNGLADRLQFDVFKAGETGYEPASFDIVVGIAILHHLHTILPAVYKEIAYL